MSAQLTGQRIQYLGPRETAPEHRHRQNAFRFVVEGAGVWAVVNGDPVRMGRSETLPAQGLRHLVHHAAIHLDVERRDLPADGWNVRLP